jgi:hypothetical protein
MIGKQFQIRNGNFDNPQIDKDQADYSADETTGKEKSLKKGNFGPQKHTHKKHACQPAENQHGFKGKRGCHIHPLVLLLFEFLIPQNCRTGKNKKKAKPCQINNFCVLRVRQKMRSTVHFIVFDILLVIQHKRIAILRRRDFYVQAQPANGLN